MTKVSFSKFFNAFEFIFSVSSGFDLLNLFENKKKAGSMFLYSPPTSKFSTNTIMNKTKGIAKEKEFYHTEINSP